MIGVRGLWVLSTETLCDLLWGCILPGKLCKFKFFRYSRGNNVPISDVSACSFLEKKICIWTSSWLFSFSTRDLYWSSSIIIWCAHYKNLFFNWVCIQVTYWWKWTCSLNLIINWLRNFWFNHFLSKIISCLLALSIAVEKSDYVEVGPFLKFCSSLTSYP